jgi:hypothetical protein
VALGGVPGWHLAGALVVPGNITLLSLPPRSPELNPVENVWQLLRDNWLSNRVFNGSDDCRRTLLRRLERRHRPALAHPLHRSTCVGGSSNTSRIRMRRSGADGRVKTSGWGDIGTS